ncbi:MAG TPA: DoxX family protein [Aliidongia sp.]|uniref:DoxX family protein n=1 Tax=Aliidongia sp. TaxID=1914230 RepID=UPI002DDD43AB|nr:DoxX family protein [Aliidongia sp.]HEV2677396.1 DoxX family protein [Aliidongia sp.]
MSENDPFKNVALLAARILFTPLFYYSGIGKILAFSVTASRLPGGGGMLGKVLAAGALSIELGCGTAVLLGLLARPAASILIAFTFAATLMFHQFWAATDATVVSQTVNFLKNLGLMGGLGLIATFGPGNYSLQAILLRPRQAA